MLARPRGRLPDDTSDQRGVSSQTERRRLGSPVADRLAVIVVPMHRPRSAIFIVHHRINLDRCQQSVAPDE